MNSNLPEDIVHIIHLFLPIESLLRFKAVSKSWYYSITRQKFIKDRIDRINKPSCSDDSNTCRNNIVYTQQGQLVRPFVYSIDSDATDPSVIDFSVENCEGSNFEIVASCNGMVLIHETKYITKFFLCNTSTGNVEHIRSCYTEWVPFGLGYDEFNDEYKFFTLFGSFDQLTTVQLYSLTNNKVIRRLDGWICDCLYLSIPLAPSVVVNNFPHWITRWTRDLQMKLFITSFHATNDDLRGFHFPGGIGYIDDIIDLSAMSGCLCICCNQCGRRALKIYSMTEYGCSESWVPLFYVPHPGNFQQVKPLGFLKNGRVLMEVDSKKLVVYDLDEKRTEKTLLF